MHIIKLNAIGSTNTFLKGLASDGGVKNYTTVTSDSQFEGRGQMGKVWESEPGKNLTFSVFVQCSEFEITDSVYFSYAVSLAVFEILNEYKIPNVYVKWPNDILADSKKICGLLIENSFSKNKIKYSIVGIGLNVNQEVFSDELSKANSIKNLVGKTIDRDVLLEKIISQLKLEISNCIPVSFENLKERYLSALYKYKTPAMFENSTGVAFMGKIVDVNDIGNLVIEHEDESLSTYGLKEIKMLR